MDKTRFAKLALVVVVLLSACNLVVQPSTHGEELIESEKPSAHGDQASMSAVGSWQGTLTTTVGGSGTQPFTAEIRAIDAEEVDYEAVFTIGETVYTLKGFYNGANDEGDIFIFEIPLAELRIATSPAEFYGLMWSGPMTEKTYSGGWFLSSETKDRSPAGEFALERLP